MISRLILTLIVLHLAKMEAFTQPNEPGSETLEIVRHYYEGLRASDPVQIRRFLAEDHLVVMADGRQIRPGNDHLTKICGWEKELNHESEYEIIAVKKDTITVLLQENNDYYKSLGVGKMTEISQCIVREGKIVAIFQNVFVHEHCCESELMSAFRTWLFSQPDLDEPKLIMANRSFAFNAESAPRMLFWLNKWRASQVQAQEYLSTFTWSPDSKRIIFGVEKYADKKSSFSLYVVNADGSQQKMLISNAWSPSWSKDGTKIVYAQRVGNADEIYLANPDGSQPKQLTKNSVRDIEPVFSGDGQFIIFSSYQDGKSQFFRMKIDGSNQEKLFASDVACYTSSFPVNGNKMVFYKDKGDHMDKVYTFDLATKKEQLITDDALHNFYPSWTPDGRILFTSTLQSDAENKDTGLYVIDADGKNRKRIGDMRVWFARMSPDGKKIAYTIFDDDGSCLYVANADGSGRVCIVKR